MLPVKLKSYFWDVRFEQLDANKNQEFIINRVLNLGDQPALRWLMNQYQPPVLKRLIQASRQLSPKSANFWAIYFNIPKTKIKCLQPRYLKQRSEAWPY